jgi:hypothetical protein
MSIVKIEPYEWMTIEEMRLVDVDNLRAWWDGPVVRTAWGDTVTAMRQRLWDADKPVAQRPRRAEVVMFCDREGRVIYCARTSSPDVVAVAETPQEAAAEWARKIGALP